MTGDFIDLCFSSSRLLSAVDSGFIRLKLIDKVQLVPNEERVDRPDLPPAIDLTVEVIISQLQQLVLVEEFTDKVLVEHLTNNLVVLLLQIGRASCRERV